jgi:hypothetical protein
MYANPRLRPVGKAAELLDQRWTLLVLRERLAGNPHLGVAVPRTTAEVVR